jgi:hypothetical protein
LRVRAPVGAVHEPPLQGKEKTIFRVTPVKEIFMKKAMIVLLLLAAGIEILSVSCVSNTNDPTDTTKIKPGDTTNNKPLETNIPGKWKGWMFAVNLGDIHFNGALVFLNISSKDSSPFRMVALDTTNHMPTKAKDTMLILSGTWSLINNTDSIALKCSYCRVVDTMPDTLYDRPIESEFQRIALPVNISNSEKGIVWEVGYADLAPLIPILGLSISSDNAGLLRMLKIGLFKMEQE